MSGFADEVLGGSSTLIRKAVKSPNYVPGVSGWSINKDGTAEFNNVTIRGLITAVEELLYSGNPALGNLIASVVAAATTDTPGNAVIGGITSYVAPGLGTAIGLNNGELTIYTGPTTGAGPWTPTFTISGVLPTQIGFDSAQNPGAAIVFSTQGGGITHDGLLTGGQRAFILPANSPESYHGTSLVTSPNLQVTGLLASAIYRFKLFIVYDGTATGPAGLKWNVATDGTGYAGMIYEGTTGAQVTNGDTFPLSGHSANTVGVGSYLTLQIEGVLNLPGNTTGAVAMQFAQNITEGTNTKIYSGILELERIG